MRSEFIVPLCAVLLAIVIAATIGCLRYRECRSHGFSRFYCLTQK